MSCLIRKPLILLTNDDGIYSPGLRAAAEATARFGDILVCAPHRQQTGMGRSFPREADSGIVENVENYGNGICVAYAVHGSPSLSVAHGVMELADRKPDLCVSGINYGENLGQNLTCSGTVGAALEAVSYGIPAIAVSLETDLSVQKSEDYADTDWRVSQWILKRMIQRVLKESMPRGVDIWNINVPKEAIIYADDMLKKIGEWENEKLTEENCPYRFTRQSRQNYFCFQKGEKRNRNKPYRLPVKLEVNMDTLEKDSDIYAVYVERKISITPITVDMTAHI